MTSPAKPAEGTAVAAKAGHGVFQVRVESGGYTFQMDEPVADGGLGAGPNPFDMLRAALASCTLMTIRAYAERKGWPAEGFRVQVTHRKGEAGARDRFDRVIELGDVSEEQRERLLGIADRCPVHLLLERGADTAASLAAPAMAA
jgi:putative redox protein